MNGVAALHSHLIATTLFKDFYDLYPAKFQNKVSKMQEGKETNKKPQVILDKLT